MSVLGKKWLVKNHSPGMPALKKILENRGFSNLDDNVTFHDPALFSDMEKALERIDEAINKKERIIVFGDYDVDGISGTAVLFHILKKIGATTSYRLPNRVSDGYGLSEKFIQEFHELGIGLIITVDCGISCADLITLAKSKNIDSIITDHHTIPENIPADAIAILHPRKDEKYPFKELTGSAVALKLAYALIRKYLPPESHESELENLIDLASLGVVADLGPLVGENRYIVKKGLEILARTKWIGLKKILELADIKGRKIDTSTIGFRIAPRINAAGRIGDPYLALSLLLQETYSEKVHQLGTELEKLNTKRQDMTLETMLAAEEHFLNKEKIPAILIAENTDWHVGVLGLVAGRLAEKYGRPTIILQDFGDTLVASARSPEYFNVVEAITHAKEHLISFGGHAQAAGFNLEKKHYNDFKKAITQFAEKKLKNMDLRPTLEIDCEILPKELNFDFLSHLEKLEPFGIANTKPTFLINNIEPLFINQVGKQGSHLKFNLRIADNELQAIGFRMGQHVEILRRHKKIDLVCQLERNRWNNREYLQLHVLDFREVRG